jgi:mannose-6-phosphate isomerase-like protein (cupin superfamily)
MSTADYVLIDRGSLADSELQGYQHGGANVCLIFTDAKPGHGPFLHRHPYEEIFIVLEGRSRFTAGSHTLEAGADQIVIIRPGVPHKFVNCGEGRLRQVNIHDSPKFTTEWLEDS